MSAVPSSPLPVRLERLCGICGQSEVSWSQECVRSLHQVQEVVEKLGPPLFRLARATVHLALSVSQVHTSHLLIIDLDWQRATHRCSGIILIPPHNSSSFTRIVSCLYEVDVLLVLPYKTMYSPNGLGFVLASVKVNILQTYFLRLDLAVLQQYVLCFKSSSAQQRRDGGPCHIYTLPSAKQQLCSGLSL